MIPLLKRSLLFTPLTVIMLMASVPLAQAETKAHTVRFAPVGYAMQFMIAEDEAGPIKKAKISLRVTITEGDASNFETVLQLPMSGSGTLYISGRDLGWEGTGDFEYRTVDHRLLTGFLQYGAGGAETYVVGYKGEIDPNSSVELVYSNGK